MYKKAWCTCKDVVLLKKPIVFLTFSLPSASLDLKVPNNSIADNIGFTNCYIIRLINHNGSADLHTSIHPRLYMTTKFSDFSEKLSANMLFYSGRDMDVNIDVTIGIKFCQPCSSQFALFKKKNVLIIFLPMELWYYIYISIMLSIFFFFLLQVKHTQKRKKITQNE